MRDIFLLVGKSSVGKDYVLNELVKTEGWKKMVSYTTRPMRPHEVEGHDYHFLKSNYEFEHLLYKGELFEKTEYLTVSGLWLYGFGKKSIHENAVNVAIVNPDGVRQMAESDIVDRLYIVYIDTQEEFKRLMMYGDRLGREMSVEEKAEAFDRILRDIEDFRQFEDDINYEFLTYKDTGIPVLICENNYDKESLMDIVNDIQLEYFYEAQNEVFNE